MTPAGARRQWLLAGLAVVVGLAGLLIAAEVVLRLLPVRSAMVKMPVNAANPVMHFRPNRGFTYSMGWNLKNPVRGHVNNYGFVNDQDYDSSASSPLLAVVGDSYIEALMVKYPETLHGRLAARAGPRGRVYSFGMSGAALAQYLVEADFARSQFRPNALVVLIVGNDFDESLLRYRPAPGHHYFVEGAGGVRLERLDFAPSLLRRVIRKSAVARYLLYNVGLSGLVAELRARARDENTRPVLYVGNTAAVADSARVAGSKRAIDVFLAMLPSSAGLDPSRILLVVDGIRPNLYDAADLARTNGTYYDLMRRYVLERAPRLGYEVVDLQPRLIERHQRDGAVFEFPTDGHWNATAHQEAAAAVERSATFRRAFGDAR